MQLQLHVNVTQSNCTDVKIIIKNIPPEVAWLQHRVTVPTSVALFHKVYDLGSLDLLTLLRPSSSSTIIENFFNNIIQGFSLLIQ